MLNPYKSGAFGGREKVNSSQASTIRIAPNDTKSKKCYNITWAYEPIVARLSYAMMKTGIWSFEKFH